LKGKEKKSHGMTAPGRTLLSINDKSDESKHNTREEIADDLNWSTGKVAQADVMAAVVADLSAVVIATLHTSRII
jgi:hypothetical protein